MDHLDLDADDTDTEAAATEPERSPNDTTEIDTYLAKVTPAENSKVEYAQNAIALVLDLGPLLHDRYYSLIAKKVGLSVATIRLQAAKIGEDSQDKALFRVGDQTEIAAYLVAKYTADDLLPIYDEGSVHRWDPERGIWSAVSEDQLARDIMDLSGSLVGERRRLSISNDAIRGSIKCLVARIRSNGFFSDVRRDGVAMANGFARCTCDGVLVESLTPEHRQRHRYDHDYLAAQIPTRFVACLRYAFRGDEDAVSENRAHPRVRRNLPDRTGDAIRTGALPSRAAGRGQDAHPAT